MVACWFKFGSHPHLDDPKIVDRPGWLSPGCSGRKLRSQTSDNMDRWKSRGGKSQRREEKRRKEKRREEERISKKRKSQKKEDPGALKGRKVAKHCVFSNDLWLRRCCAKHISKSKMCRAHRVWSTFGSWDVEKVHAVVARSKLPSENVLKYRRVRTTFGRSDVISRGRRKGLCTLSKVSKNVRVL